MPVSVDDLDLAVRNIQAMRDNAQANGLLAPYAVLLPKPLYNALKRSGRRLPFEVELYPITKAAAISRGMRGRTRAGL